MRSTAPSRQLVRYAAPVGVALCLLAACSSGSTSSDGTSGDGHSSTDEHGCVTGYVKGKDYFPDKVKLTDAHNFTVDYHDSYEVVTVKEPAPQQPPQKYVLYRCGTPAPGLTGDLSGAQAVKVPITSMYSGSTTHLPLLDELDELSVLKGVASGAVVTNEHVRQMIADKKVVEYAPKQQIDVEKVIASKPDLLMTDGTDNAAYPTLRQGGVPVVANAEWLESTPLGRAEWIKLMGSLTGQEAKATKVFDQISDDYRKVAAQAASAGSPVSVLPGEMYQGTWYMPGGDSYVAALLKDANATYAWSGVHKNGVLNLSLEDVFTKSRGASVWLMDTDVKSLSDVTKMDPRYADLTAFKGDKVWSNNAKVNAQGGNDYWESGVTRPDLVLADLVKILHPDAAKDHQLVYYRQVAR